MRVRSIFDFIWKKIKGFFSHPNTQKVLGILLFFSIAIVILFTNFSPKQVSFRPDEEARRNIQSNINAVIIDEKQTLELKNQAASKVQKVYQEDKYALSNTLSDIENFYITINEYIDTSENPKEQIVYFLNTTNQEGRFELNLTTEELADYLLRITPEDIELLKEASNNIARGLMNIPITEEALEGVYEQADQQISTIPYTFEAKEVIKIITINSLRPNLIFNKEATDKAIKEAMDSVQPVQKTIKAGEIIVREGDRVTLEQISILEQLGIQRSKSYPLTLIGVGIFVLLTFWLFIEFIRRYYKQIYRNDMQMLLIGLIFIIMLLIAKFMTLIKLETQPELNALMGYLTPVAAASMLIAILLDNRLAYFFTAIMALYVGLLTDGNQLFYGIAAFVGGSAGIFRVYKLTQTSDLAISGVFIGIVNIITITTLSFIGGTVSLNVLLVGVLVGAVNGILSAVLMIGALPYLESAFSITSMIKLLELSNPNHNLLRRQLLEAPGTYHHSLMVGNLAEATAEAIGANPLLVRVGAYYHDIGKIKRPEYFVENQRGYSNPHEKIAPALSALIITSHVKEGVELAREANLPQVIIDFIEQHHGTSLAKYFYNRALEEDDEGQISEESFRYEGPKPQSKEVALVMLADSVEAAVRSLKEPTTESIRNMVNNIIKDKLNDGQLEMSDLTFRDLHIISESFCTVIEGVYHKRIEYPEVVVKELEKRRES
ncbi:MAG: HDIG domain-containing protein [Syntrophomonadaceae bacterium]|nr:HDIG domain-containing protein [Syntrophomonadaceae bacterium]